MKKIIFALVHICLFTIFSCKDAPEDKEKIHNKTTINYLQKSRESFDDRMAWWKDAKFGMFIHWGPYAVPAGIYNGKEVDGTGEWIMDNAHIPIEEYEKYAKQFNPNNFNAEKWAKLMKRAGIKYVVITSKHHDGFSMWDSKVANYDIVDYSPYGKDVLKQLSKACKKEGIKFGLYHSIMDWHNPHAQGKNYPNYNTTDSLRANPAFPKYFEEYLKPQLKELIENYDPDVLWFDGEWIPEYTHQMGQELYQYLRELKPSIIINNRVDKGRQGMQGMDKGDLDYAGDFGTPEQEILESSDDVDWESCMTMNDTWGFKKNDHNWKPERELIHNLIDVTAKGGNYLLNIGPNAQGEIPEPSIERLKKIGEWVLVNEEAIYGTERLKKHFKEGDDIRYTKKKDKPVFYGISLTKPVSIVHFSYIKPKEGSKIYLLGLLAPLQWDYKSSEGLFIEIPEKIIKHNTDPVPWVFKIEGEEVL